MATVAFNTCDFAYYADANATNPSASWNAGGTWSSYNLYVGSNRCGNLISVKVTGTSDTITQIKVVLPMATNNAGTYSITGYLYDTYSSNLKPTSNYSTVDSSYIKSTTVSASLKASTTNVTFTFSSLSITGKEQLYLKFSTTNSYKCQILTKSASSSASITCTTGSSSSTTYKATLNYDANGGSGAPSSQTVTGTSAWLTTTISSTIPTRSGYSFLGWSTSSSATSATYTAGNSIDLSGSTSGENYTLYAVWQQNVSLWTATTTYQNKLSNYYSGGSTSFSFELGSAKVGYCLFRPTKSGSITVYSSYSGTSYDMYGYLVSEGISFDQTASTVTGLFSNYLARNDDGNGSGQFKITYNVTAGQQYRIYFCCYSKTSASSGNIHFTFTAVNNTYTITCKDRKYNSSGVLQSTTTVGSETYEEGETAKGSYWGTSSPYTGYEYSGCTTISSVSSNSTVYRNFYPITYTVSYNLNGVSGTTPSSTTRNYNESYTLTSTTPTNTKYTFIGWNTNPSATTGVSSETVVTDTDSITQAADITYYAIWKIKTYTVTINYNLNGGINGPSSWSQTANVGTNITTTISSTKPTKNRYKFVNWSEGNSATTYDSGQSVSFSSATILNLYATWEHLFGADNVYYGVNGEWKLVETYYGVNGQWVPLKIYYGDDNKWKNNT